MGPLLRFPENAIKISFYPLELFWKHWDRQTSSSSQSFLLFGSIMLEVLSPSSSGSSSLNPTPCFQPSFPHPLFALPIPLIPKFRKLVPDSCRICADAGERSLILTLIWLFSSPLRSGRPSISVMSWQPFVDAACASVGVPAEEGVHPSFLLNNLVSLLPFPHRLASSWFCQSAPLSSLIRTEAPKNKAGKSCSGWKGWKVTLGTTREQKRERERDIRGGARRSLASKVGWKRGWQRVIFWPTTGQPCIAAQASKCTQTQHSDACSSVSVHAARCIQSF